MISNNLKIFLKEVVEDDNFIKKQTNSIMRDLRAKILNKHVKLEDRVMAFEFELDECIQELEHRLSELRNKYKTLNENFSRKLIEAKRMLEESERRLLESSSEAQS